MTAVGCWAWDSAKRPMCQMEQCGQLLAGVQLEIARSSPMYNTISVSTLIFKCLAWCEKHRSPRTLEWYKGLFRRLPRPPRRRPGGSRAQPEALPRHRVGRRASELGRQLQAGSHRRRPAGIQPGRRARVHRGDAAQEDRETTSEASRDLYGSRGLRGDSRAAGRKGSLPAGRRNATIHPGAGFSSWISILRNSTCPVRL